MSYSMVRPDGVAVRPAATAETGERVRFLQKVYMTLFSGIVVFGLAGILPVVGMAAEIPVLAEVGMLFAGLHPLVALAILIGSSFAAQSVSMVRGLNIVAFYGFAVVFGLISVSLFMMAMAVGGPFILVQALGITCLVFGGLSGFVLVTGKDLSHFHGFLMIGLFVLLGAVVTTILMQMAGMALGPVGIALSILAAIIFSGFVLTETSKMLYHYSTDMVMPAALSLLISFIIIFRSILVLLMMGRD